MYKVQPIEAIKIDGVWDKTPWNRIPELRIENHMGRLPAHKPVVKAKIASNKDALYVIFQVKDQYVKAVADHYQGEVYKDSCVEFFFTPGSDPSKGYFNLEINCGGTALFHYQKTPRKDPVFIPEPDFEKINIAHSLPKHVYPEIKDSVVWTIEYNIPFRLLEKFTEVAKPGSGTIWKANFYKCGDETSHPHWLTWNKIDHPVPDFHRPEFFGKLVFQ